MARPMAKQQERDGKGIKFGDMESMQKSQEGLPNAFETPSGANLRPGKPKTDES